MRRQVARTPVRSPLTGSRHRSVRRRTWSLIALGLTAIALLGAVAGVGVRGLAPKSELQTGQAPLSEIVASSSTGDTSAVASDFARLAAHTDAGVTVDFRVAPGDRTASLHVTPIDAAPAMSSNFLDRATAPGPAS